MHYDVVVNVHDHFYVTIPCATNLRQDHMVSLALPPGAFYQRFSPSLREMNRNSGQT